MQTRDFLEIELDDQSIPPLPIAATMQIGASIMEQAGSLAVLGATFKIKNISQTFLLNLSAADIMLYRTSKATQQDSAGPHLGNVPTGLLDIIYQIIDAAQGDVIGIYIDNLESVPNQIGTYFVKCANLVINFKKRCQILIPIGFGLALAQQAGASVLISKQILKQLAVPLPRTKAKATAKKTDDENTKLARTYVQQIGQCFQEENITEIARLVYQLAYINRPMALQVLGQIFDQNQGIRDQIIKIYKQDKIIISDITLSPEFCRAILSDTFKKY